MTKKSIYLPLFISALLFPYTMLLIGNYFYNTVNTLYVFVILMILSVVFNRFAVKKLPLFILLSANTSVCSSFSFYLSNKLYYFNVSSDDGTLYIGKISTAASALLVIAISVIAWFFVRMLQKKEESKQAQAADNSDKPKSKSKGDVYSVLSLAFVIASYVITAADAFLAGYQDYYMIKIHFAVDSPEVTVMLVIIALLGIGALLLFVIGLVFSYSAVAQGCSNIILPLTARRSGYLYLVLLGSSPVLTFILVGVIGTFGM